MDQQNNQIIDLFGVARRRGKLMAVVAGAVILATFWVSMALPNLYTSAATILVEPQSIDENLVASGVRESDLNDRLSLMTAEILSRARLSDIITDMNLYEDEHDDLQRFEVVELMREFISVEPVASEINESKRRDQSSFNTFRIVFSHENRYIARDVAQRVANDFINANIESRRQITAKSLEFMRDEIARLKRELASVEKAISETKSENAGRLPEDFDANQRLLQFAMGDLRSAQRAYDEAMSDAGYWKNQVLTAYAMSTPGDQADPAHRLRMLELDLGNLLARGYTDKHPDVVRVQSEIALLEEQIAKSDGDDAPKSFGEQNARAEQGRAELRAAAAKEDIERLRDSIAELESRLAATPAVAERLDGLTREYEQLYASYQDYSARLQQAGVQADLERRQLGEKFGILEPAEVATEPSSPNRILLLSLGAFFGLALGLGVGLLAEFTDSSLHTTSELQGSLGIPVLVSVPRIMLESDRVARSRRILRETIAAVGVVLFVLAGGVVTYYVVNHDADATSETKVEPAPARAAGVRADQPQIRG
jgi:polysaccharide chain length determinant protein (PEP-CTERM system associated)